MLWVLCVIGRGCIAAPALATESPASHDALHTSGPEAGALATDQASHAKSNLPILTLGAIGVVYGDIGTSPIFVFRQAMHSRPGAASSHLELLGLLSFLVCALTPAVLVAYDFLVT